MSAEVTEGKYPIELCPPGGPAPASKVRSPVMTT
jgi:hypothetical protein